MYSLCPNNNIDGDMEEIQVTANSSNSNSVANTDGTMTALSVEWMAEDLNTGLPIPTGDFRAYACPQGFT